MSDTSRQNCHTKAGEDAVFVSSNRFLPSYKDDLSCKFAGGLLYRRVFVMQIDYLHRAFYTYYFGSHIATVATGMQ